MAKNRKSPMLRGELETRRQIREHFAEDFELVRRVLELGYQVHASLCAERTSGFGKLAKGFSVGLYTKLCKQYRAIHSLCELGLTDDAEVLVRSMFESSLVIIFLLQRRVVYRHGKRTPPPPPGGRLTVGFRAKLYAAGQALKDRKQANALLSTPGLEHHGKKLKKSAEEGVSDATRAIGKDWIDWLKKGTILGLSIEVMAGNLKLGQWYASIYRSQSSRVHASDALDHLDLDDVGTMITPKLGPNADSPTAPMHLATILFMQTTDAINDRFRLGHDGEIKAIWEVLLAKSQAVDEV